MLTILTLVYSDLFYGCKFKNDNVMYNITMRHICATTVAEEKQKVSYILSACV
jgi:hypothetical protein